MAYIQEFKTKRTINGVVYYLTINHEEKTYATNRLCFDGIRISQRTRRQMIADLKNNGYTER